ncbi:hypothetical protein ASPZODRAFT_150823 [Penicilliopsis zonata CBS 506.65]|uniref:RecQ-mediated genome instability protein 1 n=1 Tax=Penicilliopsis zonata CBS 506.65 TaxID=1073090 RepID=A0A1L9SNE4_9EURO|nr:hypothetical protein ASPZODRAFT_150823 [Penicilliopsis zonata CBS 506.65]OJJ48633.1 hypothetical protein ASPZODRAFT_150823 [Penicilliopsis zonata CBS 506.65]
MTPQEQIAAQLLSTRSLPISQAWLDRFVATSSTAQPNVNVPISGLTRTALFRVLASDFRETLSTANRPSLLPSDVFDPTIQERRLQGVVPVQILDIEDIGSSLWSQVEAIERVERGEAVRGREIVRTVNLEDGNQERDNPSNNASASANTNANNTTSNSSASSSHGPHRLIVQDAAGTRAVAVEIRSVEGVAVDKTPIGAKLLLRNASVARGMVLLTPETVTYLGGKIEAMDRAWREGRKERLLSRLSENQP